MEIGCASDDCAIFYNHGAVIQGYPDDACSGSGWVAIFIQYLRCAVWIIDHAEAANLRKATTYTFDSGDRILHNLLELSWRDIGDDGYKIGER